MNNRVEHSANTYYAGLFIIAGMLLSPFFLYSIGILWVFSNSSSIYSPAISPLAILVLVVMIVSLIRNRIRVRTALNGILGMHWKQIIAAMLVINLASLMTAFHVVNYAGNLYWGIEEGNQYSYRVQSPSEYHEGFIDYHLLELNDSVIVFTIDRLPEIPLYCDGRSFCESLVKSAKASVTYENGSNIDSDIELGVISLFSNAVLPLGDWDYIDSLYYDRPNGGLGSGLQNSWFSKSFNDYFLFGKIVITCTESSGWDADVSYEDGVPITIRSYPLWWGLEPSTLTLIQE
ncbi:MAG: hypothetical protein ACFFEX_19020 [Candidatus Thorarchaeota archaeon]